MAPKPPGRPAAKDISDLDILEACDTYTRFGAPFPSEGFIGKFPAKVIGAKLAKVHRRGWINAKRYLTPAGRQALATLQDAPEAAR